MNPAVFGAIFAGIGALTSILGGRKEERAAKKAGEKEKALEAAVTQEKIRQMNIEEKVLRGETIAQVAGSGVKVDSGSPLMVLAEQAREFSRQREVTLRAGATKMSVIGERAANAASQARYSSYSNAASQFGTMFSILGGLKG